MAIATGNEGIRWYGHLASWVHRVDEALLRVWRRESDLRDLRRTTQLEPYVRFTEEDIGA